MLHFPLLGGKVRTLAADLGMGASYDSSQSASTVSLTLTFTAAGAWAFTVGAGDTLTGTPSSGTWGTTGYGAATRLRITPSGTSGVGTITNDAASFVDITTDRIFRIVDTGANTSTNLLIEIQEDGGGDFVNESIVFSVT